jgi:hypothetical protein
MKLEFCFFFLKCNLGEREELQVEIDDFQTRESHLERHVSICSISSLLLSSLPKEERAPVWQDATS